MRKLLRFMRRRIVFSIWETRKKMRKSSRSFSKVASNAEDDPCSKIEKKIKCKFFSGLVCSNCNRCQGCSLRTYECFDDPKCIWSAPMEWNNRQKKLKKYLYINISNLPLTLYRNNEDLRKRFSENPTSFNCTIVMFVILS